jgi:hypothetical protein
MKEMIRIDWSHGYTRGGVHQGIDILFSNFFGDRNEEWAVAAQH